MRSFHSLLFLASLLLAAFLPVTARIPKKEASATTASSALDPSHRIILSEYQQPKAVPAHLEISWHRSLFDPISEKFRALGGSGQHRSLGGGQSSMQQRRRVYQQQEWAYNPETGELYWWIWLIIGLVSGLVGCCCCLSLFRFGSAKHYDQKVKEYQEHQKEQRPSLFPNDENQQNNASEQQQ